MLLTQVEDAVQIKVIIISCCFACHFVVVVHNDYLDFVDNVGDYDYDDDYDPQYTAAFFSLFIIIIIIGIKIILEMINAIIVMSIVCNPS